VADLSQDRREVCILAMGVDTTTPTGKLVINVLGAIRLMLERQREGIAKAKCEGKYRGRAPTALVRLA
jgi:DNA invertase Pin-like site-specific DNA recombinase